MKTHLVLALFFVVSKTLVFGQGVFIYDQQSDTDETPKPGTGGIIQQSGTMGQSFTPTLSSIGFIRLKLNDNNPTNSFGAVLFMNLRSDSITGPLLSSTAPVSLTDGFAGPVNFFFPSEVPLIPGTLYYFEPKVQSGDLWRIDAWEYNYPGGIAYGGGLPGPGGDLWFREGIVVPEPSSTLPGVIGVALFAGWRRLRVLRTKRLSP
jgi:hypothetical protein